MGFEISGNKNYRTRVMISCVILLISIIIFISLNMSFTAEEVSTQQKVVADRLLNQNDLINIQKAKAQVSTVKLKASYITSIDNTVINIGDNLDVNALLLTRDENEFPISVGEILSADGHLQKITPNDDKVVNIGDVLSVNDDFLDVIYHTEKRIEVGEYIDINDYLSGNEKSADTQISIGKYIAIDEDNN